MTDVATQFARLTDRNQHTEATQYLNGRYLLLFPDSAVHKGYEAILANISVHHELAGYMPDYLGKLRDAIQATLIVDLRAHGIEALAA